MVNYVHAQFISAAYRPWYLLLGNQPRDENFPYAFHPWPQSGQRPGAAQTAGISRRTRALLKDAQGYVLERHAAALTDVREWREDCGVATAEAGRPNQSGVTDSYALAFGVEEAVLPGACSKSSRGSGSKVPLRNSTTWACSCKWRKCCCARRRWKRCSRRWWTPPCSCQCRARAIVPERRER